MMGLFLAFSGCFSAPELETIAVKKCEIPKPQRPIKAEFSDSFEYLKAIFRYAYELESRADICE